MKEMSKNPESFGKIINTIVSTGDVNQVLSEVADEIQDYLIVDRCSLYVLDSEKNELFTRIAQGIDFEEIRVPVNKGSLVGFAVSADRTFYVKDAYDEKALRKIDDELTFNSEFDKESNYRTKSVLCMPLKYKGETVGAFQLVNKPGGFREYNVEAMREFSPFIALALNNAVMTEEMEKMKLQLKAAED